MGIISSKKVDNNIENPELEVTPRNTRILHVDPRSPAANFVRTPIAVSNSPSNKETPATRLIKKLSIDPRSPSNEVLRTPILTDVDKSINRVEESSESLKLKTVTPLLASFDEQDDDNKDPRSPTSTVPRTPLDEKENSKLEIYENSPIIDEENLKQPNNKLNKKLFTDSSYEKERRPLICLLNKNYQPKDQIQALQCRNIEEEFNKNEKNILKIENTQNELIMKENN